MSASDPEGRDVLDYARIGSMVEERQEVLGLSWTKIAERAGVTERHIRTLRQGGGGWSIGALEELSLALRWPRDALVRIGHGEPPPDPIDEQVVNAHQRLDDLEERIDDLTALVRRLVEQRGPPPRGR